MELDMSVERDDGRAIIVVRGEIDLLTAPELASCIDDVLSTMTPDVLVLDMAAVDFLDSAGVRVIIGAFRGLGEQRERLVVEHANTQLRRVLEVTGVDACVTLVD